MLLFMYEDCLRCLWSQIKKQRTGTHEHNITTLKIEKGQSSEVRQTDRQTDSKSYLWRLALHWRCEDHTPLCSCPGLSPGSSWSSECGGRPHCWCHTCRRCPASGCPCTRSKWSLGSWSWSGTGRWHSGSQRSSGRWCPPAQRRAEDSQLVWLIDQKLKVWCH